MKKSSKFKTVDGLVLDDKMYDGFNPATVTYKKLPIKQKGQIFTPVKGQKYTGGNPNKTRAKLLKDVKALKYRGTKKTEESNPEFCERYEKQMGKGFGSSIKSILPDSTKKERELAKSYELEFFKELGSIHGGGTEWWESDDSGFQVTRHIEVTENLSDKMKKKTVKSQHKLENYKVKTFNK